MDEKQVKKINASSSLCLLHPGATSTSASGEATADGMRESEKESESDELDREEFLERWNYGKVVAAIKRIGEDTTGPDCFAVTR